MIGRVFHYAYVQARTRALKSRLLESDDWHYLLRMRSIDDILRYLSATDYGPFLPRSTIDRTDTRAIFLSLHDALFTDYLKLITSLPRCRSTILYGLAARYDAENIKTLLRGIWKSSAVSKKSLPHRAAYFLSPVERMGGENIGRADIGDRCRPTR